MYLLAALGDVAETIAKLVAPWSNLYSDSKAVSAGTLFLHLAPLLISGGAAVTMDRATIRASRGGLNDRARQLKEHHKVHQVVVPGLVLSVISGLFLFMSDVETFLPSVYFWAKIVWVFLLLLNGYLMLRTERLLIRWGDKDSNWSRMRLHAQLSIALWLATMLAGIVLATFA